MISIIVILYNSGTHLDKCLSSLIKSLNNSHGIEYEIIFINNDSISYKDIILKYFSEFIYVDNNFNYGFSKSLNLGVRKSIGSHILALNPDIEVNGLLVKNIFNTFELSDDIGIVGGKVLNIDGTFQESSRRRIPTFTNIIQRLLYKFNLMKNNKYNYSEYSSNERNYIESISGCCMMFTRKLYDKISGFDERFFLYFEDTDFCKRAIENNYKVVYNPDVSLNHFKGGSTKFSNYFNVQFHFYCSMVKFFNKHSNLYKKIIFIITILLSFIYILLIN